MDDPQFLSQILWAVKTYGVEISILGVVIWYLMKQNAELTKKLEAAQKGREELIAQHAEDLEEVTRANIASLSTITQMIAGLPPAISGVSTKTHDDMKVEVGYLQNYISERIHGLEIAIITGKLSQKVVKDKE